MQTWAMKTFKVWAEEFIHDVDNAWIGIDQEGFDDDYRAMDRPTIDRLILARKVSPAIVRNFDQFCYDMKIGDYICLGVGSTTNFNVKALLMVTEDYSFDDTSDPRHVRNVKVMHVFGTPVPYPEFNRVSRLECITEADYGRMIARIFKP